MLGELIKKRLTGPILFFMLATSSTGMIQAADWVYTVRPGDTLWDIADKYLISEQYAFRVQARNRIANPRRIPPGTRVSIPVVWLKRQPAPAAVASISGTEVQAFNTFGQPRPIQQGAELSSGERIETGADSNVTIEFADGSRFQLRQNSTLELDALTTYGDTGMVDTRMRLQRGQINGQINPARGSDTRYEISTPAAVASVRGTDYRLNADAVDDTLRSEVISGRVSVTGSGRTRNLNAGQGTLTEAGRAPQPPRQLLPAPTIDASMQRLERVPLQLSWQPLQGAQRYRVQLASTPQFDDLLFNETTEQTQIRGPSPADGDYFLRVRGLDDLRLEGFDAVIPITIAARPEPPFLIAPRAEEVVLAANPGLQWSQSTEASAYRLQLAITADFASPLVDLNAYSGTQVAVDSGLAEGEYYWRVASLADSKQGPYSDVQMFRLRPSPQPELALDETEMTVQWPDGLPGERFHFQLSADAQFSRIIEDQTLAESSLTLSRPTPGDYYMRVAIISANGVKGSFGATQVIAVPNESLWPYAILSSLLLLLAL